MPDRLDVLLSACNLSTRRFRWEDGKFNASMAYIMILSN